MNPVIFYTTHKKEMLQNSPLYDIITHNQELNPGYESQIYDDKRSRSFIKSEYDNVILECFDKLIPGAYRADLIRLLLLYRYGGTYIDVGLKLQHPLPRINEDKSLVLVKDLPHNQFPGIYNAYMASDKGHPFIKKCIEHIVENILNEEYGIFTLDITGPTALGRVFKEYYKNKNPKYLKLLAYRNHQIAPSNKKKKKKRATRKQYGDRHIFYQKEICIEGKNALYLNHSKGISAVVPTQDEKNKSAFHYGTLWNLRQVFKGDI